MENASKALLIAAGVLIGVLILSMAVYLAHVLGEYAAETQSKIDENSVAQFNARFLQYAGLTQLTIQDVITVKNYALENNKEDVNYNPSLDTYRAGVNNDYIDVYFAETKILAHNQSALILGKNDEDLLKSEMLEINSGKEYNRFTCEVEVNAQTGRVNKIYFYGT